MFLIDVATPKLHLWRNRLQIAHKLNRKVQFGANRLSYRKSIFQVGKLECSIGKDEWSILSQGDGSLAGVNGDLEISGETIEETEVSFSLYLSSIWYQNGRGSGPLRPRNETASIENARNHYRPNGVRVGEEVATLDHNTELEFPTPRLYSITKNFLRVFPPSHINDTTCLPSPTVGWTGAYFVNKKGALVLCHHRFSICIISLDVVVKIVLGDTVCLSTELDKRRLINMGAGAVLEHKLGSSCLRAIARTISLSSATQVKTAWDGRFYFTLATTALKLVLLTNLRLAPR
ncbi:hypothetical protein Tco_0800488 [Tanacetum coccineum]|uniref:Uncharacterized protein n=1 Tax=Tanacetum coccineum TaxID=301880 RepID=A0ABQ4ZX08_9ASTR